MRKAYLPYRLLEKPVCLDRSMQEAFGRCGIKPLAVLRQIDRVQTELKGIVNILDTIKAIETNSRKYVSEGEPTATVFLCGEVLYMFPKSEPEINASVGEFMSALETLRAANEMSEPESTRDLFMTTCAKTSAVRPAVFSVHAILTYIYQIPSNRDPRVLANCLLVNMKQDRSSYNLHDIVVTAHHFVFDLFISDIAPTGDDLALFTADTGMPGEAFEELGRRLLAVMTFGVKEILRKKRNSHPGTVNIQPADERWRNVSWWERNTQLKPRWIDHSDALRTPGIVLFMIITELFAPTSIPQSDYAVYGSAAHEILEHFARKYYKQLGDHSEPVLDFLAFVVRENGWADEILRESDTLIHHIMDVWANDHNMQRVLCRLIGCSFTYTDDIGATHDIHPFEYMPYPGPCASGFYSHISIAEMVSDDWPEWLGINIPQ